MALSDEQIEVLHVQAFKMLPGSHEGSCRGAISTRSASRTAVELARAYGVDELSRRACGPGARLGQGARRPCCSPAPPNTALRERLAHAAPPGCCTVPWRPMSSPYLRGHLRRGVPSGRPPYRGSMRYDAARYGRVHRGRHRARSPGRLRRAPSGHGGAGALEELFFQPFAQGLVYVIRAGATCTPRRLTSIILRPGAPSAP